LMLRVTPHPKGPETPQDYTDAAEQAMRN